MLPTEKSPDQYWDKESEIIVKAIARGDSFFLTGPAGTGKSELIKSIKRKIGDGAIITSTTGISAMNIGGVTIHSFSGIGIHNDPRAADTIARYPNWPDIRDRIRSAATVMLDEISMMRSDTLTLLERVFQMAMGSGKSFGGKPIIFSGDFLQLPPVPKHTDDERGAWAFDSTSWRTLSPKILSLTKIHRQHDKEFLTKLSCVRMGECPDEVDSYFEERSALDLTTRADSKLRFFPTNREADSFNQVCLEKIPAKEIQYSAKIWGLNHALEGQIRNSCNALEHLVLKLDARVIVLINDSSNRRFANGSMGTVTGFDEKNNPIVRLDKCGSEILFETNKWELKDYRGKVLAEFNQIPLRPAYGITIHKSQGLTLDHAVIDCRRIFAPGQAYVALSRVRESEGLYLTDWNRSRIIADHRALNFYESLPKKGV